MVSVDTWRGEKNDPRQGGGEGGCLSLEAAPEAAAEGFCQVGVRHECVEEGGSAPEGP